MPIVEIRAPQGNYDYQNKYFSDDTQYLCPAPLDEALTQSIQALAVRAFNALDCEGWARVDFMLRATGQSLASFPDPAPEADAMYEAEMTFGAFPPGDYVIEISAGASTNADREYLAIRVTG